LCAALVNKKKLKKKEKKAAKRDQQKEDSDDQKVEPNPSAGRSAADVHEGLNCLYLFIYL